MVVWIIGLSSSGKTTIGKKLYSYLKHGCHPWFFLDGDLFRHTMNSDLGYTKECRYTNGKRLSSLCKMLDAQGINVLSCLLSNHPDIQKDNRETIANYKEVYVNVDLKKLTERDNKQIYKKALDGKMQNVVGIDIPFYPPCAPDIIIDNNEDDADMDVVVNSILDVLNLKNQLEYKYTSSNLLQKKEKYEYSDYLSNTFFDLYYLDRKNCLNKLICKHKKLLKVLCNERQKHWLADKYNIEPSLLLLLNCCNKENLTSNNLIHTKQWLLSSLEHPLNVDSRILFKLIQQFEVSKKLYTTYINTKNSFKKQTSIFDELLLYVLFSLLLVELIQLKAYNVAQSLVLFNALLKNNDILSSCVDELIMPHEIALAKVSFSKELWIFELYKRYFYE